MEEWQRIWCLGTSCSVLLDKLCLTSMARQAQELLYHLPSASVPLVLPLWWSCKTKLPRFNSNLNRFPFKLWVPDVPESWTSPSTKYACILLAHAVSTLHSCWDWIISDNRRPSQALRPEVHDRMSGFERASDLCTKSLPWWFMTYYHWPIDNKVSYPSFLHTNSHV